MSTGIDVVSDIHLDGLYEARVFSALIDVNAFGGLAVSLESLLARAVVASDSVQALLRQWVTLGSSGRTFVFVYNQRRTNG